jgi:hypothetical protein
MAKEKGACQGALVLIPRHLSRRGVMGNCVRALCPIPIMSVKAPQRAPSRAMEQNKMATSGLSGPHALTNKGIDDAVTQTSAGAYALGRSDSNTFYISYVGRSDSDLNARLKNHVGNYTQFKFGYLGSPKAAFEKECNLYHDFNPPDNSIHPDRPKNSGWKCPRCKVFD